ncbi:601_t:CDS:2 [Funneliformis geosporum]|nr:601_t:CDS:2 [Funneliformis geosporum]
MRLDGRGAEQIRPLEIKIDYLPNVHGSAVFARGETKVLSVITVGKISEKQLVDSIFNRFHKYFIHHYNFPPFAVNEMASYRSVSRREIGHGELVEKTFDYLIPSTELFPYTVRAVSEVLSSDGSSSQASICATSLSLMATGVPLTRPAAGIALGLFEGQIYSDINGLEDKLGEMDFKIAGTEKGVCSLQLDVKNQGISQALIKTSFEKARQARSHLLKEMKSHIYHPRPNLPTQVIKCRGFYVEKEKIGLVIGPRGKTINQLTEETGSTIEVQNDGYILVYHQEEDKLEKTYQAIKRIIKVENKKPVETVYELKDEYKVPSFEEFMKTYEPSEEVEVITEAEYQNRVLHGSQYGPGNERKNKGKKKSENEYNEQHLINTFNKIHSKSYDLWDYENSVEKSGVSRTLNFATSSRTSVGFGGAIASGEASGSVYREVAGNNSVEVRFLSGSIGGEIGAGSGGTTVGYSANADLARVRAGALHTNIGLDGGSNFTAGPGGIETKVAGFGFSVGKKMGLSTPFGGVSVDTDDCVVQ